MPALTTRAKRRIRARERSSERPVVVLIVDDDQDSSEACAASLEGMRVICVDRGAAALEEARRTRPDVILLDIEMPEMDGRETLRRLKADPATRDIPVVVLTGESTGSNYRSLTDAGCAAYLIKPCRVEDLEGVVTSLSEASRRNA
jgi:CheY-like chemotaxis protein